jgi:DNA-binding NarL/FixJ family response regulator
MTAAWRSLDRSHPVSIVLVNESQWIREGVAQLINAQQEFRVVTASADDRHAAQVIRDTQPDVVLLDWGRDVHGSLTRCTMARTEAPESRVIVLGLFAGERASVTDHIRAGASGFVVQDASFESLLTTIRAVHAGIKVLPEALVSVLFAELTRVRVTPVTLLREPSPLTARESEVVDLLAQGLSNRAIASRLDIRLHTVKSHVHNVLEKLELRSRLEVAAIALAASERTQGSRTPHRIPHWRTHVHGAADPDHSSAGTGFRAAFPRNPGLAG